ncbi:MAG TPA: N-acetylneuraminate synthase family protein [Sphingobacteriaceae bacterium]
MKIANYNVGTDRVFIIAEIGNNHNGDIGLAKKLIDLAVEMGADCAKFQMRHLDKVYRSRSLVKSGEDLGTEYLIDLLNRFELSKEEHRELAEYCKTKGIIYMCTPWDKSSIDVLESFKVPAYKVASADLTNLPLLDELCKTQKPLILSTGMSRTEEIVKSVEFLNSRQASFVLLHCNSTYPAPFHDIHLKWMGALKQIHPFIGYSGHERGTAVSIAAVALGATVIERHFTLDRDMEGPDHAASLEFAEFKKLIEGIREVEQALGDENAERFFSQGEMMNRENLSKSLVAASDLKKGTVIKSSDVKVLSPGQGLSPQNYDTLLGKVLNRDMVEEDFFFPSDLQEKRIEPRDYNFKLPWGIPVRYHDIEEYNARIKPDLFEFHLSYSDMDLDISQFLTGQYESHFVVHAPELFAGSHLMDLATPDNEYRKKSLYETQRVIDITRAINRYFPNTSRPMIVANVGGFTMDAPLPKGDIVGYYKRFAESLQQLDMEGVEIIPQTMAPFPWHFGGQRFQNIFVLADEIVEWCDKLNLRMCFDVSHSHLTCTHFKMNYYEFAEKIAPFTAHIHLGDARGVNGEGLQINEGDIDFKKLGGILTSGCPEASFIPEIWQGHKNGGEGFWIALERLEGTL